MTGADIAIFVAPYAAFMGVILVRQIIGRFTGV